MYLVDEAWVGFQSVSVDWLRVVHWQLAGEGRNCQVFHSCWSATKNIQSVLEFHQRLTMERSLDTPSPSLSTLTTPLCTERTSDSSKQLTITTSTHQQWLHWNKVTMSCISNVRHVYILLFPVQYVPYNVSVTAFTSAGEGPEVKTTAFTKQGGLWAILYVVINLCSFLTTLPPHTQLPLQSTTSPPDASTTQQCTSHGNHLLSAKPEASSLTTPSHYPQCPYLKRRELVSSLEQYQPLKQWLWWLTWNLSSCTTSQLLAAPASD